MPINWGILDPNAPARAGQATMQGFQTGAGIVQQAQQNAMAQRESAQRQESNNMALSQAKQEMADKNAMRRIYSGGGDVQAGLQAAGFGEKALAYGAAERGQRVAALSENKAQIEDALTKYKAIGQISSGVVDQQSYDMAKQEIARIIGPEAAANMPPAYDPNVIEANRQKSLTVQEQLFNNYKDISNQLAQDKLELQRNKPAGSGTPYFTPLQTGQGVMSFDARTGTVTPVDVGGGAVVGSTSDPRLQQELAGAKARGKVEAVSQAEAVIDLPRVVDEGKNTIKLIDELLAHPGLSQSVGKSRMAGVQKVPGTAAFDFQVMLDQIQGKQFLQAFQSLKGGGQITEVEGKKATQAMARMNASSSEKAFKDASRDFQAVIKKGIARAEKKAGIGQATQQATPAPTLTTQAEYDALPSGTEYIDPDDGQLYRKP